jgi:hypothetical protein
MRPASRASMSDVISAPFEIWISEIRPLTSPALVYVFCKVPEIFVVVRSASVI